MTENKETGNLTDKKGQMCENAKMCDQTVFRCWLLILHKTSLSISSNLILRSPEWLNPHRSLNCKLTTG